MAVPKEIKRISETVWEIPASYKQGMLVPARIYATEKLLRAMDDGVFDQVTNVAALPGIVSYALCMPDGHWGIGGVAAIDTEEGVISPGGIGFDINCGMRLVLTNLTYEEVRPNLHQLVDRLFQRVPAGVGGTGFVTVSKDEFLEVAVRGAEWCIDRGYGWVEDLARTEEFGRMEGADVSKISERAIARGYKQIGTLGVRQPLSRDSGGQAREHFRRPIGEGVGNHASKPGGHYVPLRQPWIRSSSGNRLFAGVPQGDGEQIRD